MSGVATVPGSHIQGWMAEQELAWLHAQACKMDSVVEIGSWKGRSTYALCASGCPRVYAVDTFKGSIPSEQGGLYDATEAMVRAEGSPLPEFWANVGHFENLRVLVMPSEEAAGIISPSVSMVFIDGSHDYDSVRADIRAWRSRAVQLICGHDYQYESVRRAVRHQFEDRRIQVIKTIWAVEL